jgi:hypothetical protein
MHTEARNFTLFIKELFPIYFLNKKVLDVGGSDMNGNNKFLFENCSYHSNDVVLAPNVTIVSKTSKLPFKNNEFELIIQTGLSHAHVFPSILKIYLYLNCSYIEIFLDIIFFN